MAEFTITSTYTVTCPACDDGDIIKVGQRNGYQRYKCNACKKKFRANGTVEGKQFDADQIGATIRDYYMGLSFKQIAESMEDRYDIPEPSKDTLFQWVREYTDKASHIMKGHKAQTSGHWVVDEMIVKVGGENVYHWNVMDAGTRYLLASHLARNRTAQEAAITLQKALAVADRPPAKISTDKYVAYPPAIRAVLPRSTKHVQSRGFRHFINNNLSERMQGTYRSREKTLRGLDSIENGQRFLDGYTLTYNLFRDHHSLKGQKPGQVAKIDTPFKEWADVVRSVVTVPKSPKPTPRNERPRIPVEARKGKSRARAPRARLPDAGMAKTDYQLPMLLRRMMGQLRPKPPGRRRTKRGKS